MKQIMNHMFINSNVCMNGGSQMIMIMMNGVKTNQFESNCLNVVACYSYVL